MARQPHQFRMAATLTLALLLLGCSGKEPGWNNEGVEPIQLGPRGWVHSLAFSPDSKYLAVSSEIKDKGFAVTVWEVSSQTEVFTTTIWANQRINAIAFSPDGKTMAFGGWEIPLTLWDTSTWKEKARPAIAGVGAVQFLTFHPKEELLFVAGSDGVLVLWDLKADKARYRKETDKFGISAAGLSPDGSTLVTGGQYLIPKAWEGASGKVWEAASGKELWSFAAHPSDEGVTHVSCVAFLPDGTFATLGNDDKVRLWDLKAEKEKAVFSEELSNPWELAVSPNGEILAVGGNRRGDAPGLVEFWEVSTGKRLAKLNVPSVGCVALSPDGKWLATGTNIKKRGPNKRSAVELWKMAEVLRKKSE
jgi:WD40 repeat protein